MNAAARTYGSIAAESAPETELVVLCLEAALRYEHRARDALERRDARAAREDLARVRAIVGELLAALDPEPAPELAARLARLYTWMIVELGRAGWARRPEQLRAVMKVTRDLLDGFSTAFRCGGGR